MDLEIYWAAGQQHHRLFANTLYHDQKQGIVPTRKFYGKGIVGDGARLFFAVPVLDDDRFIGAGKNCSKETAVLPHPFMEQIPCLHQTDDKAFLLVLFEKLLVELPPVSSTVNRIYSFVAHMLANRPIS